MNWSTRKLLLIALAGAAGVGCLAINEKVLYRRTHRWCRPPTRASADRSRP